MPKQSNRHLKGSKKGLRSGRDKNSGKYTKQRIRTLKNKNRKRIKHKKKHPNDTTPVIARLTV